MPQAAVPLVSLAQDLPQSHPMAVLVVPMPLATANLLGKLVPHPTTVQGVPVLAARSLLMTPLVPATVLAALGHHVQAKTGEQAADVVKVVVRQKHVMHIAKLDARTPQLAHRRLAAVHQNRRLAMHDHMRRLRAFRVLDRPARRAKRDNRRSFVHRNILSHTAHDLAQPSAHSMRRARKAKIDFAGAKHPSFG